jgi:hypothetical protein
LIEPLEQAMKSRFVQLPAQSEVPLSHSISAPQS